jgi:hypothetical protein
MLDTQAVSTLPSTTSYDLIDATLARMRSARGNDQVLVLEEFSNKILPRRYIQWLVKKYPGCFDIGCWSTNGKIKTFRQLSLLVTFAFRSPNRCVKRQARIWLTYSEGDGCIVLLQPNSREEYKIPPTPGETTYLLIKLLKKLMQETPRR